MRSYVKHSSPERLRLRHEAFAQPANRRLALEILQKQPGIAGVKPGPESFLLFLEPEAEPERICEALEERLPGLARDSGPMPKRGKAAGRGNPCRKTILKAYLATGVTTIALATLGLYRWHKAFGWIFAAFAVEHVWARRKAL